MLHKLSGNDRAGFGTLAGGQAEVTDTFAAALVPEATSWALLLAGLGAAGPSRHRPRPPIGQLFRGGPARAGTGKPGRPGQSIVIR